MTAPRPIPEPGEADASLPARRARVSLPVVHVVSDSLGDTAAAVAFAAASQFPAGHCTVERLPKIRAIGEVEAFLDVHQRPGERGIILFHTIANHALRAKVVYLCAQRGVYAVDLLGPAIDAMSRSLQLEPSGNPGGIRVTDDGYFRRIDAMEYSVNHDDGRNPEGLIDADIVLIGISRTSKTPLSIFLASKGYKVANIPLVPGVGPPEQLYEVPRWRVYGLISSAPYISEIRYKRLGRAVGVAGSYADVDRVQSDLDDARALMRKLGCLIIKTDNRAIEETAQEILRYYLAAHEKFLPDERVP